MLKKIAFFVSSIIFVILFNILFSYDIKASIIPPRVFTIYFEGVASSDNLTVGKTKYGRDFAIYGIGGGRVLNIYSSGTLYEESSNFKNTDFRDIKLSLKSTSENIRICSNLSTRKICGQEIEGNTKGSINFVTYLTGDAEMAESIFLHAYRNRDSSSQLETTLERKNLMNYKNFSSLIESRDKQKIEDFQIFGTINNNRFTINGAIYFEPNFSNDADNLDGSSEITVFEVLRIVYILLALIFIAIPMIIFVNKSYKESKSKRLLAETLLIIAVIMWLIYFIFSWFFGIQLV